MRPEEKARNQIDELLEKAGWIIQDYKDFNLGASLGVAIREFPLGQNYADYLLFVDRKAVGVIEAKHIGTTLSGVAEQSQSYITRIPENLPCHSKPLPFAYESTGIETFFRDIRDLDARSRRVFAFHQPETLYEWLSENDTLRTRLKNMESKHQLITTKLRECQIEAIKNLEQSFAKNRPRSLIQMATGSGKTYTAVSSVYRLIKFAKAKRILFLVDRTTLGRQTLKEFQGYVSPDDGRKFIELYNVQNLSTNKIDPVNKVVITTIQRLYSMLRGEEEFDTESEEISSYGDPSLEYLTRYQKPKEVSYNPNLPIETFDFIITDECHRSIYNLWRQALEYFDAFIVGLTATPSKQTIGFFNNNLVMQYSHERAVIDKVNVGYEVYRIATQVTEKGSKIEAKNYVEKRDKKTRKSRWEELDADLEYNSKQLDKLVSTPDQIRTIIRTFKEKLPNEIFPGRSEVPKTLIFAKDDSHAEEIVHIIREEFGRGNEFCKKITYRTSGEKPEDLIASFRNSYYPRIAVTVDMIATGTDIKPLECLIFMRDVKSSLYFEQMKGRGTRVINSDDFNAVTPDAKQKTHFVIVDAIGVCESIKSDTTTLERKKNVSFEKLLTNVAIGYSRDDDTLTSLAYRLTKLEREIDNIDKQAIEKAAGEKPMKELVKNLIEAYDPDVQIEKAKELFNIEKDNQVTEEQIKKVSKKLVEEACKPFDNALLRNTLIEIKNKNDPEKNMFLKQLFLVQILKSNWKDVYRIIIDSEGKLLSNLQNYIPIEKIKIDNILQSPEIDTQTKRLLEKYKSDERLWHLFDKENFDALNKIQDWDVFRRALKFTEYTHTISNSKALSLLKNGRIEEFNKRRSNGEFSKLDLSGINLENANLDNANLSNANLEGINLRGASLKNANLYETKLEGASLTYTKFDFANLSNANLSNADLAYTSLVATVFSNANLFNANLSDSIIVETKFDFANLSNANLSNANSQFNEREIYKKYDLIFHADFSKSNLTDVNLSRAKLSDAVIINLRSYYGVNVDDETDFSKAIIDLSTFIDYMNNYTSYIPTKISNKKELLEKLKQKDFDKKIIDSYLQISKLPD